MCEVCLVLRAHRHAVRSQPSGGRFEGIEKVFAAAGATQQPQPARRGMNLQDLFESLNGAQSFKSPAGQSLCVLLL